jgi:hypothetical protein
MTLCVAHKQNDKVILVSDSRISRADKFSDVAIKINPLHINIKSARDADTGEEFTKFTSTYGFAFAGTFAAQNAIKDFLTIALQKLKFIPISGELTFVKICQYISDLYKHVVGKNS